MTTSNEVPQDGRADFDWMIGRWNIHHRRLKGWLQGSTSWEEFSGTAVDHYILGGKGGIGSISQVTMHRASGTITAFSVRLFDPEAKQWSIHYVDGVSGIMASPMRGSFMEGCGKFYAQETFNGKYIFSRFLWTDITPTSCHWEQAFSEDGGNTWETNWVMDLTRVQE